MKKLTGNTVVGSKRKSSKLNKENDNAVDFGSVQTPPSLCNVGNDFNNRSSLIVLGSSSLTPISVLTNENTSVPSVKFNGRVFTQFNSITSSTPTKSQRAPLCDLTNANLQDTPSQDLVYRDLLMEFDEMHPQQENTVHDTMLIEGDDIKYTTKMNGFQSVVQNSILQNHLGKKSNNICATNTGFLYCDLLREFYEMNPQQETIGNNPQISIPIDPCHE